GLESLFRETVDEFHQLHLLLEPARLEAHEGREIFRLQSNIWRRALPAHAPDPFGEQRVDQRAAQTTVPELTRGEELCLADLRRCVQNARVGPAVVLVQQAN